MDQTPPPLSSLSESLGDPAGERSGSGAVRWSHLAWVASCLLHVGVLWGASAYLLIANTPEDSLPLDSLWQGEEPESIPPVVESVKLDDLTLPAVSNASSQVLTPDQNDPLSSEGPIDPAPVEFPKLPTAPSQIRSGSGTKTGGGSDGKPGTGRGRGGGGTGGIPIDQDFFADKLNGRSFVFVLDASLSMKHPHKSEAKTRFGRLQLEVVKSVGKMTPEQRFFIVFFNDRAHPMPANSLIAATPDERLRYLDWVVRVKPAGETDPRSALRLALRLQPDVIYFLTDGSFDAGVGRELMALRQDRTQIFTFAFGNKDSQGLLKAFAERNRGRYTFVP